MRGINRSVALVIQVMINLWIQMKGRSILRSSDRVCLTDDQERNVAIYRGMKADSKLLGLYQI